MFSTIENKVNKTTEESSVKTKSQTLPRDYQYDVPEVSPWLSTGLVFAGLSLAITLSIMNGQLFLKELGIGSSIIMGLMILKSLDSK